MSEALEQLFGEVRLKLLRFFFRNGGRYFNTQEISKRTQIVARLTSELDKLYKIKALKRKKSKGRYWYSVDRDFFFYSEIKKLVLKSDPVMFKKLTLLIKKLGSVKLAIVSGVLIDQENSRVDLFLVGDYIIKRKLELFLKKLEADVGREISYSVIKSADFKYRQSMFDNFIKEILHKPHVKLINRMGI